ncbi:hypothetical protein ACFLQZ_03210 [Acidobacteriota bacterium]
MDKNKLEILFQKIMNEKYSMNVDFISIEGSLQHLKEGNPLTYSDLLIIGDDSRWPFSKYWLWPSKEQIKEKLPQTEGWFKDLNANPNIESKVIGGLDEIFKNIALVSIILRFIFPDRFAIYSRPPLKILRIERGSNDIEEFLNYLAVLRLLKRSFKVSKTADLDIIVWTISREKGEYSRELKKLLAERLPENLNPGELINLLSTEPLKIAEVHLKQGAWREAGYYAACHFEKIRDELWIDVNTLKKIRNLRNMVIHEPDRFTKNDARNLIEFLKKSRTK